MLWEKEVEICTRAGVMQGFAAAPARVQISTSFSQSMFNSPLTSLQK